MSYSCVKFLEHGKKRIMTVPSNWIVGESAYWLRKNKTRSFEKCLDPCEDWTEVPIYKEVFRGNSSSNLNIHIRNIAKQLVAYKSMLGLDRVIFS